MTAADRRALDLAEDLYVAEKMRRDPDGCVWVGSACFVAGAPAAEAERWVREDFRRACAAPQGPGLATVRDELVGKTWRRAGS